MIQELNQGTTLSDALGTGLSGGLAALAQQKLQQVQQRNQQQRVATGLGGIPGINPEQAQQLSYLDDKTLSQIIGDMQRAGREKEFASAFNQPAMEVPQEEGKVVRKPSQQQMLIQEAIQQGYPAPRNSKEALDLAKVAHENRLKKQEFESKQQREIDKETLPYYNELSSKARAFTNNSKKLDKIDKLVAKGNFGSPLANSLINTISKGVWGHGIDLTFLKTADAQELEKLSTDFVKDAKEIFGSRLTDADLSAFFKTLPNLSQSREGMSRVIRNLRIAGAADELRKQAADRIIEENGGRRPRNLESLVEGEISPQLDILADQFKLTELNKPKVLGSETIGSLFQNLGINY